jgi:hypothetical protein
MRQKTQYKQLLLAFAAEDRGETPGSDRKGTEPLAAKRTPESPAAEERLMEEVCERLLSHNVKDHPPLTFGFGP